MPHHHKSNIEEKNLFKRVSNSYNYSFFRLPDQRLHFYHHHDCKNPEHGFKILNCGQVLASQINDTVIKIENIESSNPSENFGQNNWTNWTDASFGVIGLYTYTNTVSVNKLTYSLETLKFDLNFLNFVDWQNEINIPNVNYYHVQLETKCNIDIWLN